MANPIIAIPKVPISPFTPSPNTHPNNNPNPTTPNNTATTHANFLPFKLAIHPTRRIPKAEHKPSA